LGALTGVESQLQSHIRISLNTGLSSSQLRQVPRNLAAQGNVDAGARVQAAIDRVSE